MYLTSNIWGVHAWKFFHQVAWGYPHYPSEIDKNNYKNFFNTIGHILPCKGCGVHYNEILSNHPLTDEILLNREDLMKWTIDIHNHVNQMLNKKIYTHEEGIELIQNNFMIQSVNIESEMSTTVFPAQPDA